MAPDDGMPPARLSRSICHRRRPTSGRVGQPGRGVEPRAAARAGAVALDRARHRHRRTGGRLPAPPGRLRPGPGAGRSSATSPAPGPGPGRSPACRWCGRRSRWPGTSPRSTGTSRSTSSTTCSADARSLRSSCSRTSSCSITCVALVYATWQLLAEDIGQVTAGGADSAPDRERDADRRLRLVGTPCRARHRAG